MSLAANGVMACLVVVLLLRSALTRSPAVGEHGWVGDIAPRGSARILEAAGHRRIPEGFTGISIGRYPNGAVQWQQRWVDGRLEGEALEWSEDGTLKTRVYYRNFDHYGLMIELFPPSKEDGGAGGVGLSHYDGEGQVFHLGYTPEVYYWPNGKKMVQSVGLSHPSGSVGQVGPRIEWYENGQLKSKEGHDIQGREHGTCTIWHPNGQKAYQGTYEHGKKIGVWTTWNEEGEKTEEAVADANGNLVSEGHLLFEVRVPEAAESPGDADHENTLQGQPTDGDPASDAPAPGNGN